MRSASVDWLISLTGSTETGRRIMAGAAPTLKRLHLELGGKAPFLVLRDADLDAVLLPDEPYAFTADDGPEAFPGVRCALVSGRDLTWYGPSLATARDRLLAATRG